MASTLESLPAELHVSIFDQLDPGSHLDLALTSRAIFRSTGDILKYHRARNKDNSVIGLSTEAPAAETLTMLRLDPIAKYHIRKMTLVESSRQFPLLETEVGPAAELEIEVRRLCRDLLPSHLQTADEVQYEQADIRAKAALLAIASCSRLRDLTLELLVFRHQQPRILQLFAENISKLYPPSRNASLPASVFSSGLQSLRRLTISGNYFNYIHASDIAPCFLLPSIEIIQLLHMADHTPDITLEHHQSWKSPSWRGQSGLKTLLLKKAGGNWVAKHISALISLCAGLETIIFNDCHFPMFDNVVVDLAEQHGATLQTLAFFGDVRRLRAHNGVKFSWDLLPSFQAMKIVTVDVLDMIPSGSRRSPIEARYQDESQSEFFQRFVDSVPKSLEVLILMHTDAQRLNDKEMRKVGDALIELVKSGRCPKLNAIYVDQFEDQMRAERCQWGAHTDGFWLTDTKATVTSLGVRFYSQEDVGATKAYVRELWEQY
jgi:hypothetical protein